MKVVINGSRGTSGSYSVTVEGEEITMAFLERLMEIVTGYTASGERSQKRT